MLYSSIQFSLILLVIVMRRLKISDDLDSRYIFKDSMELRRFFE